MTMDNDGSGSAPPDDFPDAETVIDRFGGIRPSAAKLGVPVTTVQGWKNRGRIPENRHALIRDVAARLGVDLGSSRPDAAGGTSEGAGDATAPFDCEPDQTPSGSAGSEAMGATGAAAGPAGGSSVGPAHIEPPADPQVETTPLGQHSRIAVGWVALCLAAMALAGFALVVFRPEFVANVGESGMAALRERLDRTDATAEGRVAVLNNRFGALETRIGRVEAEVSAISGTVATLRSRLDDAAGKAETDSREAVAGLRQDLERLDASIAAINKAQASLGEGLSRMIAARSQDTVSGMALLLAVGQLATEIRSGHSYQGALERFRHIAGDGIQVGELLSRLEAHASEGVPTVATLAGHLESIGPALAAGPVPPGGRDFLEAIWARIKSTISFRRIDSESRSPLTIVERAIRSGDLQVALAATERFGGEVAQWRDLVRAKQETEHALRDLHQRVLAHVGRSTARDAGGTSGAAGK